MDPSSLAKRWSRPTAIGRHSSSRCCMRSTSASLILLTAWAEVPRKSVITSLRWLLREGLEREPSQVWNSLAADSADIEALPLFPDLRRAYADGLIEPRFMDSTELGHVEAAPRGSMLEETRERRPPIDDVVAATAWWGRVDDAPPSTVAAEPYRASTKVGRNEPCPCGTAFVSEGRAPDR